MNRNFLKTATILAALAAGCLHAQQLEMAVKADVPFAFRAGEVALPAGTYVISQQGPRVILIRSDADLKGKALVVTQDCQRNGQKKPELVFHRYGDNYFLSQVWSIGATGSRLPKAAVERELAQAGTMEVATVRAYVHSYAR